GTSHGSLGSRMGGAFSNPEQSSRGRPAENRDDPPGGAHRLSGDPSFVDPYLVPCRPDHLPLPAGDKGRLAVDHDSTGPKQAVERPGREVFKVMATWSAVADERECGRSRR